MSDEEPVVPSDLVEITVALFQTNYDRLWTASFADSLSVTDTINRAINLYDLVLHARPNSSITFQMGDGRTRTVRITQ